jgi:hypothetical protein
MERPAFMPSSSWQLLPHVHANTFPGGLTGILNALVARLRRVTPKHANGDGYAPVSFALIE